MIEGLKLTMAGEEICLALNERIRVHERRAQHWRMEAERTPDSHTDEQPLLPTEMCENSEEEERWRMQVLMFIRDHIDASGVSRLDRRDLEWGELLPEMPAEMKQEEYERKNALRFGVERLHRMSSFDFCRAALTSVDLDE